MPTLTKFLICVTVALVAVTATDTDRAQAQSIYAYGEGHVQCPIRYQNMIYANFPIEVSDYMIEIAWRESGCRPWIINGIGAAGLFQITPIAAEGANANWYRLTRPRYNVRMAARLYYMAGLQPWEATAW